MYVRHSDKHSPLILSYSCSPSQVTPFSLASPPSTSISTAFNQGHHVGTGVSLVTGTWAIYPLTLSRSLHLPITLLGGRERIELSWCGIYLWDYWRHFNCFCKCEMKWDYLCSWVGHVSLIWVGNWGSRNHLGIVRGESDFVLDLFQQEEQVLKRRYIASRCEQELGGRNGLASVYCWYFKL